MSNVGKPWGGRFNEPTNKLVEAFTASLPYDRRLYVYDIEGSMAHCRMLSKVGVISKQEEKKILDGLKEVRKDFEEGRLDFSVDLEDIHMAVEHALIEKIGDLGAKLHAGRSRNDQVALDCRLYLRSEIVEILVLLDLLKSCLVSLAKREIDTVMPGYTHLQKAQPILLSHYLLAFWEMLDRDEGRLIDCFARLNALPLGSAALAGTGLKIDRPYVARVLKFSRLTKNSMDAVSDRDFVAEFIFAAAMTMMHMSRMCEDLIIWSSGEFGFVEISDAFATGSSIMPQKKNPDVAELIRGKTGRVYGDLLCILTVMKGLPMSYDRDMQEDKEALFDAVDTLKGCLSVLTAMLENVNFDRRRMREEAEKGFSTATDVAEYLVQKGVPFRESHRIVGELVGYCIGKGKTFRDLTLKELRNFYDGFDRRFYEVISVDYSIAARKHEGGTAKEAVLRRIREIEKAEGRLQP